MQEIVYRCIEQAWGNVPPPIPPYAVFHTKSPREWIEEAAEDARKCGCKASPPRPPIGCQSPNIGKTYHWAVAKFPSNLSLSDADFGLAIFCHLGLLHDFDTCPCYFLNVLIDYSCFPMAHALINLIPTQCWPMKVWSMHGLLKKIILGHGTDQSAEFFNQLLPRMVPAVFESKSLAPGYMKVDDGPFAILLKSLLTPREDVKVALEYGHAFLREATPDRSRMDLLSSSWELETELYEKLFLHIGAWQSPCFAKHSEPLRVFLDAWSLAREAQRNYPTLIYSTLLTILPSVPNPLILIVRNYLLA